MAFRYYSNCLQTRNLFWHGVSDTVRQMMPFLPLGVDANPGKCGDIHDGRSRGIPSGTTTYPPKLPKVQREICRANVPPAAVLCYTITVLSGRRKPIPIDKTKRCKARCWNCRCRFVRRASFIPAICRAGPQGSRSRMRSGKVGAGCRALRANFWYNSRRWSAEGEETFSPWEEAKRQLQEEFA